jgi:hypothetical protein
MARLIFVGSIPIEDRYIDNNEVEDTNLILKYTKSKPIPIPITGSNK